MAFPDSTYNRDGELSTLPLSAEEMCVIWDIESYLRRRSNTDVIRLRSDNFSFAGATWNLFTLAIQSPSEIYYSVFGINIRKRRSSSVVLDCHCDIYFHTCNRIVKRIKCNFKCESTDSCGKVENFLLFSELGEFLAQDGGHVDCNIKIKKASILEACSRAEITRSSNNSSEEAYTRTYLLRNEVYKACRDFKNLLLSEEGSDVTIQVKGQQFKAHRSILTARSSVFAATFRHNMTERATGVVDVADCDPSSFPVFLEFLYCGSTEKLSVENVFSLYTSTDKYDVQGLKMKCFEFIKLNLSADTFCETLKLSLQHSEANLLKLVVEYFAKNFKKIIVTRKWQAFILENPLQGNDILIKALVSDSEDDWSI